MSDRILNWHLFRRQGETQIGPAYFLEDDEMEPVAVRIHAGKAPTTEDAEFEIYADGVSIMNNRMVNTIVPLTGIETAVAPKTTIVLPKGDTTNEIAEDFNNTPLAEGSWLTCNVVTTGEGQDFTIQLELNRLTDLDEVE